PLHALRRLLVSKHELDRDGVSLGADILFDVCEKKFLALHVLAPFRLSRRFLKMAAQVRGGLSVSSDEFLLEQVCDLGVVVAEDRLEDGVRILAQARRAA